MANYTDGQECPICAHGTLTIKSCIEPFDYDNHRIHIENYVTYACNNCKEEIVDDETLERSGKILREWLDKIKMKSGDLKCQPNQK